jgi:hypothetical protein
MDPSVIQSNGCEAFMGQFLRFFMPIFCIHVCFSYLLAILLDPYVMLRILCRNDPGVPQDLRTLTRWVSSV